MGSGRRIGRNASGMGGMSMQDPHSSRLMARNERICALTILGAGLTLRILYVFVMQFNSDEPQHAHVAWGWAHGLMQYRDVFDNHTPLFHMAMAPLAWMIGDRFDLLLWMRLAMVPLYIAMVYLTYLLAKTHLTRRRAIWAAVLTAFFTPFLEQSVEFRTDNAWALLFLAAVAIAVCAPLTLWRSFLVGIVLGTALGVSMKTTLLMACLGGAAVAMAFLSSNESARWLSSRRAWFNLIPMLMGLLLVPLAIIGWFYGQGALDDFYQGVIGHNMLPGLNGGLPAWRKWFYLPALCAFLFAVRKWARDSHPVYQLLLLTTGFCMLTVLLMWPLITRQDFTPIWPLFIILLMPWIDGRLAGSVESRLKERWPDFAVYAAVVLVGASEIAFGGCRVLQSAGHHRVQTRLACWKATLDLTGPGDTVMDPKGELLFRKRAVYWVFETVTCERMRRNLLPNTIDDALRANRVCVVYPRLSRYPQSSQDFIQDNYLSVGPILVAGKWLACTEGRAVFDVSIPADYVIFGTGQAARGLLDGRPYQGEVFLTPGHHEYVCAEGEKAPALVWAKAVAAGYAPKKLEPNERQGEI